MLQELEQLSVASVDNRPKPMQTQESTEAGPVTRETLLVFYCVHVKRGIHTRAVAYTQTESNDDFSFDKQSSSWGRALFYVNEDYEREGLSSWRQNYILVVGEPF